MDISFNCTLIVQCINFGIAYVILTRFIFKPVLVAIMEERAKRDLLSNAMHASQENIAKLETRRVASWNAAKNLFGSYLKKIPCTQRIMPFSYQYEYESATDAQVQEHAHLLHDAIMKKVSNDSE